MNHRIVQCLAALACSAAAITVVAADGLVRLKSPHGPGETMDRLEKEAVSRGMKVFARVDHTAGAAGVGMTLRPTQVLIVGNPKGGTPLMQCAQSIGIDLPQKALVWQDAQGQGWLAYNDPAWLVARHGAADCSAAETVGKALSGLAAAAVAP